ncbi:YutD-like domain-containing protein [Vagococcus fluvialis]|uniref:YutD-like domain-containing protein n=1 Tax=Vagococcus fluvialis TaxID=2738 RepID=UPI003B59E553
MTEIKNEVVEEQQEEEKIDEALQALLDSFSPENFTLGQGTYKLVKNYRDGFAYEATIKRYNDVLDKYDFIVGDWGYDQLRLKGFFLDDFKSAPIDAKISTLEDYLYEYCNFGCAYFVIQQTGEFKRRGRTSSGPKKNNASKANNSSKPKNKAHTEEKRYNQNKNKKKPTFKSNKKGPSSQPKKATPNKKTVKETSTNKTGGKHQFTIRKKEEE